MTSAELARLDELSPEVRPFFEALIRAMQARGYDPFIGEVWRSGAEQANAILRGVTSKHQRLSWHMLTVSDGNGGRAPGSRAVDFRRRLDDGTEDMTTGGPDTFWRTLYAEASAIPGMRSLAYHPDGGTKLLLNGKTWDAGHVEWRGEFAELHEAVSALSPELLA